jgi:hypothetical protein
VITLRLVVPFNDSSLVLGKAYLQGPERPDLLHFNWIAALQRQAGLSILTCGRSLPRGRSLPLQLASRARISLDPSLITAIDEDLGL